MVTLQPTYLRRQAKELAQTNPSNPKRLVLLHTAVALGSVLLITALNYILNLQIANAGGLTGLPLRTTLSTVQIALELFLVTALPFWEIGLLFAALNWTAGKEAAPRDFLQGFRRIGAIIGLRLMQGFLFFAIGFAIVNLCSTLFLFTPWATPLLELIEPLWQSTMTPEQAAEFFTPDVISKIIKIGLPMYGIAATLFAAVSIPLFYRLRFAKFAVMNGAGALGGLVQSVQMTHKNRLNIFKLDLSFWWFYLLQGLCFVISYGNTLLSLAGITLPISTDAAFFLFYILSAICQGLLLWKYQAQVLTAYCLTYNQLDELPKINHIQKPPPKMPWRV